MIFCLHYLGGWNLHKMSVTKFGSVEKKRRPAVCAFFLLIWECLTGGKFTPHTELGLIQFPPPIDYLLHLNLISSKNIPVNSVFCERKWSYTDVATRNWGPLDIFWKKLLYVSIICCVLHICCGASHVWCYRFIIILENGLILSIFLCHEKWLPFIVNDTVVIFVLF